VSEERDESEPLPWYFGLPLKVAGIKPAQQAAILRVAWVAFVTFHIAWVCGWLAVFGLGSPYAKAGDLSKLAQNVQISARISLVREIRDAMYARCQAKETTIRDQLSVYIDKLQEEYVGVAGQRYPEMPCA